MDDQQARIDNKLQRTLGSARLSLDQRMRHLGRIDELANRRPGRFPLRVLRDASLAGVVVALFVVAYIVLPSGESSSKDPVAFLHNSREMLAKPEPGEARHLVIEGEINVDPGAPEPPRRWTSEIWERTKPDGSSELAVFVYSHDGDLVGHLVQKDDDWFVQVPDFVEGSGSDGPILVSPELNSAFFAAVMPWQDVVDELLASDPDQITHERRGDLTVITADLSSQMSSRELMALGLDVQMGASLILHEFSFDSGSERLVGWKVLIRDEDGTIHQMHSFSVTTWEMTDDGGIDDERFTERIELSGMPHGPPLPWRISLGMGHLETSSFYESPNRTRVFYTGPAPLLIEIRVARPTGDIDRSGPGVHEIPLDDVAGVWREDPLRADWPRTAMWQDEWNHYSLRARNLPEGGWTEDDLLELIEAITEYADGQAH